MDNEGGRINNSFVNSEVETNSRRLEDLPQKQEYTKKNEEEKKESPELATEPREKRRIIRNIIVLSSAYLILFTAFKGAGNLQSSINLEGGLGTSSLMAYYAAFIVSSIFLPVIMIQCMGCKWTIAVSALAYLPYMAAQFRAEFYTLIPSALAAGMGAGPIWCAISTYTSIVADVYSRVSGLSTEVVTTKLYGMFYMVYQLNQVSGNLISSLVLSSGASAQNVSTMEETEGVCGVNYCPGVNATDTNPNLERPPESQIITLASIYLMCTILAAITVAFGVDSLQRYNEHSRQSSGKGATGIQLLVVTIRLLRRPKQLLLLPIMVFFGIEKAFLGAEYTAVYVSCSVGVSNVGYTMICYGVTNSACAYLTSGLVKLCGRRSSMAVTVLLHIALLVTLFLWTPSRREAIALYVLAGIWGVLDGFWLVQINSLISVLFPGEEEAAFSNYHLWESLGYITSFGYSTTLCTDVKLIVMLVLLLVGVIGYFGIEWTQFYKRKAINGSENS